MTEKLPFKFDEIGAWSEIKLEIIEKYGAAYTNAFNNQRSLKKYYIDAFCGAGVHVPKKPKDTKPPPNQVRLDFSRENETAAEKDREIPGSPARALKVNPPFDGFHFIDLNSDKIDYLKKNVVGDRPGVHFHPGDSNKHLIETLLPTIKYENYNRALCLLDPYGMHLDWKVIHMAGQSRAIDMFLNFPVADINRNALWKNTDGIPQDGIERMTRLWGDESWRTVAYEQRTDLFGGSDFVKQNNETIAKAFSERLKKGAGFAHVAEPLAMKNERGATVYYLYFASPKPVAMKIINDIYEKYR